jgi:hypothetical protein
VNYLCPRCQQPIPLDDINVGRDVALCRRCGQSLSFAELAEQGGRGKVNVDQPPKGAWHRAEARNFEAAAITRSGAALFLIPFTLFWFGASTAITFGVEIVKGHFDPKISLFGIPFQWGTCFLVPICAMMVAGRVMVRVENQEGEIFTGAGPIGWRRRFRLGEVNTVRFGKANWRRNYQAVRQIFIETSTKTLKFASGVTEERQDFLMAVLLQQLSRRG